MNPILRTAWALVSWCTAALLAQQPVVQLPDGVPYTVRTWDTENGLPQSSIGALLQSRDGFLWVGTFGGLCRFDGTAWKTFDAASVPALGGNRVLTLHEDPDGTLWIGIERAGLVRLRDGQFLADGPWPAQWLQTPLRLRDGRLVIATERDVVERRDDGSLQSLTADGLPGTMRLLEHQGRLLACGVGGVFAIDGGQAKCLAKGRVLDAAVAVDGTVLLATDDGIQRLGSGRFEPVPGGAVGAVRTLCTTVDGNIHWAGIRRFGCVSADAHRNYSGTLAAPARCITVDRTGATWIGMVGGGLARVQRSEVEAIGVRQGLPGAGQNSIASDGQGGLLVGTWQGLFQGRQGHFQRVAAVGEQAIASILVEPDGLVHLGIEGGVLSWQGERSQLVARGAPEVGVVRALARVDGELWAGCGNGLQVVRDGTFLAAELVPEIQADVQLIRPLADGSVWVAGPTTAVWLAPDRRSRSVLRGGVELPPGDVRAVLPRPDGLVWLGLYGGGFVGLRPGDSRPRVRVDRRVGLLDMSICSVADLGEQWVVGSNLGTYAVSAAAFDALADGRSTTLACRPLAGPIGTAGETNGGMQPSAVVLDGDAYLCGVDPLLRVPGTTLATPPARPVCHIERLRLGGRDERPRQLVEVPAGVRTFHIRLGSCEFDRPGQVRYRWRLLPGGTFTPPSFDRDIAVVVDGPGDYLFEAEAVACDERSGAGSIRVRFLVPPVFYERLPVQVGGLVGLLWLGWLSFRFGAYRARRREQRMQVLVGERTVELRHAREHLEERVRERTAELQRALEQIDVDHSQKRRLERELEQLRRMESLGQLAGGVAHDFNNLLTIVLGNAAMLEADLQDRPDDRDLAMRIREAGERGRRLTRHLLTVASRQPVEVGVVDVGSQCSAMADMLRQLLGERIQLVLQVPDMPACVRGAASQIEQILMNLAVNARDAMPGGGRFTVAVRVEAEQVELRVADDGPGMAAAVRERAFEPFFTTKSRQHGTGLGLATVHGITKQMQGEVRLASAPGSGTAFTFRWPLVAAPASRVEVECLLPSPAASGLVGCRVLLIEDEADVRRAVARLLTRYGCRVVAVDSGDAAVARLVAGAEPVQVVLSDVMMPGLHGAALVRALRARIPGLPVVCMTGHVDQDQVGRGLAELGVAVLNKPLEPGDLVAALQRALISDPEDSVSEDLEVS